MKKILLDCGAHCGCTARKFKKEFDSANEFSIYSFEPMGELHPYYNHNLGLLYGKAVWLFDGVIKFHDFGTGGGSTISNEKAFKLKERKPFHPNVLKYKKIHVQCIDLSNFIYVNFHPDDYIILKLDIEGSEYDLLNHLINQETIKYINEVYIEWHSLRMGKTIEHDLYFSEQLRNRGIIVDDSWDAMSSEYCYTKRKQ